MTPRTLEHELSVFDAEFAGGDLAHALEHLAHAAVMGPVDPKVLSAIDRAARRCELIEAVPDDDHAGHLVLRAHGFHHAGRFHEAFELLTQIAGALPHEGFERLLARWLTERRTEVAAKCSRATPSGRSRARRAPRRARSRSWSRAGSLFGVSGFRALRDRHGRRRAG